LAADPVHRGRPGRLRVCGQLIALGVTGHHQRLATGLDAHAQALGDRVVDVEVADLELARGADGRLVDLPEDRLDAVLLALGRDQGERELGPDHGDVRSQLEQERDRPDVVLVRVGDHKRLDPVETVLDRTEVREDEVDAGLGRAREEHAAVHDQQLRVVFEDRHVAADLGDTTEGGHSQRALAGLRRVGKTYRHIRALHGLDAPELRGRGLAPTAPAAPAAASAARVVGPGTTAALLGVGSVPAVATALAGATALARAAALAGAAVLGRPAALLAAAAPAPTALGPLLAAGARLLGRRLRGRRAVGDGLRLGELHRRSGCGLATGTSGGPSGTSAAAVGLIFRHMLTPALRSSAARASSCSVVGGNCGSRGAPAGIPRSSSAALDIDTPPSARWASNSGRSPLLISPARVTSPSRKARRSSTSRVAATWPITLTNPHAPTESHGRFSWSSPE